jgi:hypothetical protein
VIADPFCSQLFQGFKMFSNYGEISPYKVDKMQGEITGLYVPMELLACLSPSFSNSPDIFNPNSVIPIWKIE